RPESLQPAIADEDSEGKDIFHDVLAVQAQEAEIPGGITLEGSSKSDAENLPSVPASTIISSALQEDTTELPQQQDGDEADRVLTSQGQLPGENVVATTNTATEVQGMLADTEGSADVPPSTEVNIVAATQEAEADEFTFAPLKKKKAKKGKSNKSFAEAPDVDTTRTVEALQQEAVEEEAPVSVDLPASDMMEDVSVKKSKKDKKGKRKGLSRSISDMQESQESQAAPAAEPTPEVEEMALSNDAPSILEKTDELHEVELPTSPEAPSSTAIPTSIAQPAVDYPEIDVVTADRLPDVEMLPAQSPVEQSSRISEPKEMEISSEAPSILVQPENPSDIDRHPSLEVSPSEPTMPNFGDDVQHALSEDRPITASVVPQAQEDIQTANEATQQPLEETATFSELGEIGMTDAAPAVQEAYDKLPDEEETPLPVPKEIPGAFFEEAPDQAVDKIEEPQPTDTDPIEESSSLPLLDKKSKKKAKKAKTSDQDEQPRETPFKADVEPEGEVHDPVVDKSAETSMEPQQEPWVKSKKDRKKSKKSKVLAWEDDEPASTAAPLAPADEQAEDVAGESNEAPDTKPIGDTITNIASEAPTMSKKDRKKAKKARALAWEDTPPEADVAVTETEQGEIESSKLDPVEPIFEEQPSVTTELDPPGDEPTEAIEQSKRDIANVQADQPTSKKGKKKGKKASFVAWDEDPPAKASQEETQPQDTAKPEAESSVKPIGDVKDADMAEPGKPLEDFAEQPTSKKGKKKGKKSKFIAFDDEPLPDPFQEGAQDVVPTDSVPADSEEQSQVIDETLLEQKPEAAQEEPTASKKGKKVKKLKFVAWTDEPVVVATTPEDIVEQSAGSAVPEVFEPALETQDQVTEMTGQLPTTSEEEKPNPEMEHPPAATSIDIPLSTASDLPKGDAELAADNDAKVDPNEEVFEKESGMESSIGLGVAEELDPTAEIDTKNTEDGNQEVVTATDTTLESTPEPTMAASMFTQDNAIVPAQDGTVTSEPRGDEGILSDQPMYMESTGFEAARSNEDLRNDSAFDDTLNATGEPVPPPVDETRTDSPPPEAIKSISEEFKNQGAPEEALETRLESSGAPMIPEPDQAGESVTVPEDTETTQDFPFLSKKDKKKAKKNKSLGFEDEPSESTTPVERGGIDADLQQAPDFDAFPPKSKKDKKKAKKNKSLALEEAPESTTPTEPGTVEEASEQIIEPPAPETFEEFPSMSKKDKKKGKKSKSLGLEDELPESTPPVESAAIEETSEQATLEPSAPETFDEFPPMSKKDKKKAKKNKTLAFDEEPLELAAPTESGTALDISYEETAETPAPETFEEIPSLSKKDKKKAKKQKRTDLIDDEPSESPMPMDVDPASVAADQLVEEAALQGEPVTIGPTEDLAPPSEEGEKGKVDQSPDALDDKPSEFTTPIEPDSGLAPVNPQEDEVHVPIESSTADAAVDFAPMSKKDKKKAKKSEGMDFFDDQPSQDRIPTENDPEPVPIDRQGEELVVASEPSNADVAEDFAPVSKKDKKKAKKSKKALYFDEAPIETEPVMKSELEAKDPVLDVDVVEPPAADQTLEPTPEPVEAIEDPLPISKKEKKKSKKGKKDFTFDAETSKTPVVASPGDQTGEPIPEADTEERALQDQPSMTEAASLDTFEEFAPVSKKDKKKSKKNKQAFTFDDEPSEDTVTASPAIQAGEAAIEENTEGKAVEARALPTEPSDADAFEEFATLGKKDKKKAKKAKKSIVIDEEPFDGKMTPKEEPSMDDPGLGLGSAVPLAEDPREMEKDDEPTESTTIVEERPATEGPDPASDVAVFAAGEPRTLPEDEVNDEYLSLSKKDKKKAKKAKKGLFIDDEPSASTTVVESIGETEPLVQTGEEPSQPAVPAADDFQPISKKDKKKAKKAKKAMAWDDEDQDIAITPDVIEASASSLPKGINPELAFGDEPSGPVVEERPKDEAGMIARELTQAEPIEKGLDQRDDGVEEQQEVLIFGKKGKKDKKKAKKAQALDWNDDTPAVEPAIHSVDMSEEAADLAVPTVLETPIVEEPTNILQPLESVPLTDPEITTIPE
ncbi:MAG: hypothetical protein Q9174_004457, partial [Haloplaca sp. 1 TL-2023]